MEKINIDDELVTKAKKYVAEGRFKDLNEFINNAMKLLVYAEDNKEKFMEAVKILPKDAEQNGA